MEKKKTTKNNSKQVVENKKSKEVKENRFFTWVKENNKSLIFMVIGIIIGVLVMGILWPERIAKTKDGEEIIVKLKNASITADDLYSELKSNGGINALLQLVDSAILNDKYDLDKEAKEYAKEQSEYYYNMYEQYYGYTKEDFLSGNGFKDETAFLEYLEEQYLFEKYYNDYLGSLVTDIEVENFYKDKVFGDKYVYVFSSTNEKNSLEKVRSAIKKGTKISKIEDKYKDVVVNELGEVNFATGSFSENFYNELMKLEKEQYSKVFQDETYGYVVLYVSEADKKPELKDVKDQIIEVVGQEKGNTDSTLYVKAFDELRKAYGMKFYDDALKKEYDKTIKESTTTKTEETK